MSISIELMIKGKWSNSCRASVMIDLATSTQLYHFKMLFLSILIVYSMPVDFVVLLILTQKPSLSTDTYNQLRLRLKCLLHSISILATNEICSENSIKKQQVNYV